VNTTSTRGAFATVLLGGLVAGTLDILAAIILSGLRGVEPMQVLQSVASGLLGAGSYDGGVQTAVLGLALHYLIMLAICAIYHAAARRLDLLTRRFVLGGFVYGIVVYGVMNFVVLPLSAFPHELRYPLRALATGLTIHMLLIGLPIAWIVRRGLRSATRAR